MKRDWNEMRAEVRVDVNSCITGLLEVLEPNATMQKWVKPGINGNALPSTGLNGDSLSVSLLHKELAGRWEAHIMGVSSSSPKLPKDVDKL